MPVTPPNSSLQSSVHDTPFSVSSASQPGSTARKQKELKLQMKAELGDSVYQSDHLLDRIFRFPPPVSSIIAHLTAGGFANAANFPSKGPEPQYYPPFAKLLNAIKEAMGPLDDTFIYKHIQFEVYDNNMFEGTGKDEPIKPDLIARQPTKNAKASWKEVEFCVEVKESWNDLLAQAGTYARCILAFQRNRRFVPIIFLKQTTMEAKLGIFTASWLCITKTSMKLRETDGFERFVGEMARMLACKSRWDAGFDVSCNNRRVYIPGAGLYMFTENMCTRQSVRGRRTRVDLIQKVEDPTANGSIVARPNHRYNLRSMRSPAQYVEKEPQSNAVARSQQTTSRSITLSTKITEEMSKVSIQEKPSSKPKSKGATKAKSKPGSASASVKLYGTTDLDTPLNADGTFIPADLEPIVSPPTSEIMITNKVLILKDSWPFKNRDTEGQMFKQVAGRFGLPEVLTHAIVLSPTGEPDDTDSLFPADAEPYAIWGDPSSENIESRIHKRIIFVTVGKSLSDASGPQQLVLGVLHAILGHWNLLKAGWLHRDVSIGNAMLMDTPVARLFEKDFDDIPDAYVEKCTAFITDGDLAIQYLNPDRIVGTRRSGTPPFMSCRLIDSMINGENVVHTPIDDLESFIWVLLWAILDIRSVRLGLNAREISAFIGILHSPSLEGLGRKRSIEIDLTRSDGQFSPGFRPFRGILVDWLDYAFRMERARLREQVPHSLESYKVVYQEYLRLGFKALGSLPANWDYISSP